MENVTNEPIAPPKNTKQGSGVAYPVDTIDNVLKDVQKIIDETGTAKPISKEEIAKVLAKSVNTLNLFYSVLVQYGIFTLVHGKGYLPTDLYRQYTNPTTDDGEIKAKLQMFKSAPLYSKILDNFNGHQLPSDVKRFANTLKESPYGVNENSAEKAAKVFFENCRSLNLLVNNTLRYSTAIPSPSPLANGTEKHIPPASHNKPDEDEALFELPIPLPGKRKAYLRYPIDTLTARDINVITKALAFIKSSIGEYDEEDETKKE